MIRPSKLLAMSGCALIVVLIGSGCSCQGDPASRTDAGPAPTDGGALREIDAGSAFELLDAGRDGEGTTLPVACREIERTTTLIPPLEPGQVVLRGHEDRLLLIERPNDTGTHGLTTKFRFYVATVGEPLALLAETA